MDLHATPFRSFLKIAELGSFTRAANSMGISQPALSASIRELERRLGFDLFARTSRRVELTREGQGFLANARRIVQETEWLHQKAHEIRTNELRLAVQHHTVFFPARTRLTDGFIANRPEGSVEVLALGHVRLFDALRKDEVDLAVVIESSSLDSVAANHDDDLERLVVSRRQMRLCIPSEHALAQCESILARDINKLPVAILSRLLGVALAEHVARAIEELGASTVRPPEADAYSILRFATLARIAAIDLGWFSPSCIGELSGMVSRVIEGFGVSTQLSILRRRRTQRPAAADFWDYAAQFQDGDIVTQ